MSNAQNLASLVLHDLRDMGCLVPPRQVDLVLDYFVELFGELSEDQIYCILGTDRSSAPVEK